MLLFKALFATITLAILPCISLASISGIIINNSSSKPLFDANVYNINRNTGTSTNVNGEFYNLPANQGDSILITHLGFREKIVIIEDVDFLTIRLHPTSLQFPGITITGMEDHKPLFEIPTSASYIDKDKLDVHDNQSFQPAISAQPGVRMEQRTPGSYRISVRGSQLRAPFGVRNVKFYLNGLPFTEPGGNTHFNLLDRSVIDAFEIIRGPVGTIYGAGTGGVILMKNDFDHSKNNFIKLSSRIGSYNALMGNVKFQFSGNDYRHTLTAVNRQSEGHRDHTAQNRKSVHYFGEFNINDQNTIDFTFNATDFFYEIPGALTKEELQDDRTLARPGSESQNASIHMENYYLGSRHTYTGSNWENTFAVGGQFRSFDHPFNFDYKKSAEQVFNLRNVTSYNADILNLPVETSVGAELQRGFMSFRHYGNVNGRPDTLMLDDEITITNSTFFLQSSAKLPRKFTLTAGLSLNYQWYEIARLSDAPDMPDEFSAQYSFDPVLSPRIALLKKWNAHWVSFASLSHGYSPPTMDEFHLADGTVNRNLRPETGINAETGLRYRPEKIPLSGEVTVFFFQLRNTIVGYDDIRHDDEDQEITRFRNSGKTIQPGIEKSISWNAWENQGGFLSQIIINANYTYSHFFFDSYETEGTDYSGNKLTGVPPHTAFLMTGFRFMDKISLDISGRYEDQIPLNDANTVYSDVFATLDIRAGIEQNLGNSFFVNLYGGVNNLLNREQSLGNDLNAFGGRHYQPAPLRNYYAGASAGYEF